MKKMKAIAGVLSIFVVMPIWYWLVYQILKRVDASELMFFLFWVYLPVGILIQILTKLAEAAE